MPLYPGDTAVKKILAHREAEIPSLKKVRPDAPDDLKDLFKQMVAKRPEDRPQSMQTVIDRLETLQAEVDSSWADVFAVEDAYRQQEKARPSAA